MPFGLPDQPSIKRLTANYLTSFEELMQFPPMSLAVSNTGDRARLLDYTLGTLRSKELFRSTDLRKLSDSLSDVLNDPVTMADYAYGRDSLVDLLINIRARHESGAASARAHRRWRSWAYGTAAFVRFVFAA